MSRPFVVAFALLLALPAAADDGIPAKTLAEIKAATVFVKIETARASGSGSGFVIKLVDEDTVLVVTNEHVVRPPAALGAVRKLDVVFRSGKAKDEVVLPAEVVAADAERDLAVLRVKKVPDPPKPIELATKTEPSETMTVYTLGFPFGEALATTKGNPALTIGKGSVSSLRENDDGELAVIQIDGDINPGNSGGPVVDSKGGLIGVAVAKVKGTNIGLAIPPLHLTKMLQGRISGSSVRVLSSDKDTAEVEVTLQFIDPLEKVTAATVRLVKAGGDAIPKGKKPGDIPELTGGTTHEVKVAGQKGVFKAKVPLDRQFMQVVYANEVKKDIRVAVTVQDLPKLARGGTGPGGTPTNPLPSGETKIGDLKVNSVALAGSQEPGVGVRLASPVPCLTWTADGKGLYALDTVGHVVRRYSFPALKEEAKLEVGKECSWLSLSKEGVVVTVSGNQEAWVLDPDTLKKGTAFAVNKATRVLSAPGLSVGYVADSGQPGTTDTLRVVDLKTGKKLKEYDATDFDKGCEFGMPVLSADGKHLFSHSKFGHLYQLSTDGEKVSLAAASESFIQQVFMQPVVSADGKLVCAPCGGGNRAIKAWKERTNYSTLVFAVGNLTEPVVILKTGAYPRAVGFDTVAGLIYAQNHEDHLIVLDREGSKLKSHKLGERVGDVVQLLPHPDGRKLVMLVGDFQAGQTVFSVELPAK